MWRGGRGPAPMRIRRPPSRHQRPLRRGQEPGQQAVRGPRLLRASTTCRRRCSTTSSRFAASSPIAIRRAALVLDIRAGDPAPGHRAARPPRSRPRVGALELIYLEASDATLVSRFSETRHRHPLQATRSGVQASIAEERRRLARTRELADHVVDTTGLSIGQLKDRLFALVPRDDGRGRAAHRHRHVRLQVRACRSRPTSCSTCASSRTRTGTRTSSRSPGLESQGARLRPRPAGGEPIPRARHRAARAHRPGLSGRGQGAAARGARLHGRVPPLDRPGRGAGPAPGEAPDARSAVFHRELER